VLYGDIVIGKSHQYDILFVRKPKKKRKIKISKKLQKITKKKIKTK